MASDKRSPSTRREWIEIILHSASRTRSWSPSTRREWIEMIVAQRVEDFRYRLPPHGGSGLKSLDGLAESVNETVSLHTEGVD